MKITLEELISRDLDLLIKIIDTLPYSRDTRITLKYIAAIDFFESPQFDDYRNSFSYERYSVDGYKPTFGTVKFTNGIVNYRQLQRYIHKFISEINCFGENVLESLFFPVDLFVVNLTPSKSAIDFHQQTKYEFLKQYKLNFIKDRDINKYLKSRVNSDFPPYPLTDRHKRQELSTYYYLPNIIFDANQSIFQVEELEALLCNEVVDYLIRRDKLNLEFDCSKKHFEQLVTSILLVKYKEILNYKLKRMTIVESIKYLEISCFQFSTYEPESRKDDVFNKLLCLYNFPLLPPFKINNSINNYYSELFNVFVKQINEFKKYPLDLLNKKKNSSLTKLYQINQDVLNVLPSITSIYSTIFNIEQSRSDFYKKNDNCLAWINSTLSLSEWLSKDGVGSLKYLQKFPLSDTEKEQVLNHQFVLYCEYVESQFAKTYKKSFEEIKSNKDKILIAERDISLINDIIIGLIDENKASQLKIVFSIDDSENRSKQINNIIRNKWHTTDNYNIHHRECYADSEIIIKYKLHLNDFLSEEPSTKPLISSLSAKRNAKPEITLIAYSYKKYLGQLSALTDTLNTLIKHDFVDKKTEIIEFRKIFHNTSPNEPIVWIHGIESLAYFVNLLHDQYKLINDLGKNLKWQLTYQLFVDKEGKPYDRYKFKDQKLPTKADLLEIAVAHMK